MLGCHVEECNADTETVMMTAELQKALTLFIDFLVYLSRAKYAQGDFLKSPSSEIYEVECGKSSAQAGGP